VSEVELPSGIRKLIPAYTTPGEVMREYEAVKTRVRWEELKPDKDGRIMVGTVNLLEHPNPRLRELYRKLILEHGGKVYAIYIDGELRIIQPFKPFVAGYHPIKGEELERVAERHCDEVRFSLAMHRIALKKLGQMGATE